MTGCCRLWRDMKEPETYAEAVAFFERLPFFTKKNEPGNMVRLLRLLDSPEKAFHIVHVAGTNGKGSTSAFLESVFSGAGRKTGLFTSPHLVRINERIRVRGQSIPDEGFLESFLQVRRAVDRLKEEGGQELTYFEYLFAMSLVWFRLCGIDLMVCETGLGGRLDATRSIDKVDAAVITSISLDHTEQLGDTVGQIAYEKAGIIRENTPVIYCAKDPEASRVIARRAEALCAERIPLTEEMFRVTAREERSVRVRLTLQGGEALDLKVPFAAEYQAENACLAALCALRLGVDRSVLQDGIARTRWPGRMEEIREDVFLDGAHNPDGVSRLSEEIRRIAKKRSVLLLAAIVSDKNHTRMVRELCRGIHYAGVIVTSVGGRRQLDVQTLAKEFRLAGQEHVEEEPDAGRAYARALREKGSSVLICAGSLYLAGEILSMERRQV